MHFSTVAYCNITILLMSLAVKALAAELWRLVDKDGKKNFVNFFSYRIVSAYILWSLSSRGAIVISGLLKFMPTANSCCLRLWYWNPLLREARATHVSQRKGISYHKIPRIINIIAENFTTKKYEWNLDLNALYNYFSGKPVSLEKQNTVLLF